MYENFDQELLRMVDNVTTAKTGIKSGLISKFDGFDDLRRWVQELDEVADAALLSKLDELPDTYHAVLNADIRDDIKVFFKENPDDLDIWKILSDKNRSVLRKDIAALRALSNVKKNPKLSKFGITDEMLTSIEGFAPPPVAYAEILNDLDRALDILPENKTINFVDVVSHGKRGLVNSNNLADRRHSWYTLKKIQENEEFIRNADNIAFEVELELIDGISNAIPDIVITKGSRKYIAEVYAGQSGGVKSNLASQTIRYCEEINDLEDLRFFTHQPANKADVIKAWKDGGVLDNDKVYLLFEKFDRKIQLDLLIDEKLFENYLLSHDEWFYLLFKSNLR